MRTAKLGEICEKIGSGATPKGGKESYKNYGIHLIRSQNIYDFKFVPDGLAYIDDDQASKLNNVEVKKGDILFNITGNSVCRVCKIDNNYLPARVNQHVSIIRANNKFVLPSYILYFLQFKKPLLLQLSSSGATRNAITKKQLEEFEIPLPDLETQKKITASLDLICDKINTNNKINDNLAD